MDPIEKAEAQQERIMVQDNLLFAERRGSELADQFTSLEVQISTILLAFLGLFMQNFITGLITFHEIAIIVLKTFYVFSVVMLVGSLTIGLIHLKRKENFWCVIHQQRVARATKWKEVVDEKCSIQDAKSFVKGIGASSPSSIVHSPAWTWILQTVLLGLGIFALLGLFLTFILV